MDNLFKLMTLAAGTIITCIVVFIFINLSGEAKVTGNVAMENIHSFQQDIATSDLTVYDGLEVTGSDVVNVIKKELGSYSSTEQAPITITVKNIVGTHSYTNNAYVENIQNFTDSRYVKPINSYVGQVVFNENRVITELIFTQR